MKHKLLTRTLLVLSPLFASLIVGFIKSNFMDSAESVAAIILAVVIILGIPFVFLFGVIGTLITSKNTNAERESFYSFLVPAVLAWIYALSVLFI